VCRITLFSLESFDKIKKIKAKTKQNEMKGCLFINKKKKKKQVIFDRCVY
jgi:hypothetical protein